MGKNICTCFFPLLGRTSILPLSIAAGRSPKLLAEFSALRECIYPPNENIKINKYARHID